MSAMKTSSGSIPHPNKTAPFSIPPIIHDLIEFIEEYGVQTEGIFRINGRSEDIAAIKKHYKKNKKVDLFAYSIHTVAGALKSYLCEMDQPLIPRIVFETFAVAQTYEESKALRVMRKVLQSALTAENKIILIKCCDLLLKVCQNQAKTRMTMESIAIVFAPSWMRLESTTIADYMSNQRLQAKCVEYIIVNIKYLLLKKAGEELSRVKLKNIDSNDPEFEQFMKAMQNGSLRSASNILLNQYESLTSEKFEQQADALINSKHRQHSRSVRTIFDFDVALPHRAVDDNGPPQSPSARSSKRKLHSRQQSAIDPSEVRRKMTNEDLVSPVTFAAPFKRHTTDNEPNGQQDPSESSSSTFRTEDSSEELTPRQLPRIDTSSDSGPISSEVTNSDPSTTEDSTSSRREGAKKPRSGNKRPKKRVSKKQLVASTSDTALESSSVDIPLKNNSNNNDSNNNNNVNNTNGNAESVTLIVTSPRKSKKESNVIKAALEYQERTKKPEEIVSPLIESSKKTEQKIREKHEQRQQAKKGNNNVTFDRTQSEYNSTSASNGTGSRRGSIHKSLSEGERDRQAINNYANDNAEPRAVVITVTEPIDVRARISSINKNNSTGVAKKSTPGSPTKSKPVQIPRRPTAGATASPNSEASSKSNSASTSPVKVRSNSLPKSGQNVRAHSSSTPGTSPMDQRTAPKHLASSSDSGTSANSTVSDNTPMNNTAPEEVQNTSGHESAKPELPLVLETTVTETVIAETPEPIIHEADNIKHVVAVSQPVFSRRSESPLKSTPSPVPSIGASPSSNVRSDTPTRLASVLSPRRHQELSSAKPSTQNSIDDLVLTALSKTAAKKPDIIANDILGKLQQRLEAEKN